MVDGISLRREPYPGRGGSFRGVGCGDRGRHGEVRSGVHVGIPWQAEARHCEERSDEAIHLSPRGSMDGFAEPVIGRAFARPVGSQ